MNSDFTIQRKIGRLVDWVGKEKRREGEKKRGRERERVGDEGRKGRK